MIEREVVRLDERFQAIAELARRDAHCRSERIDRRHGAVVEHVLKQRAVQCAVAGGEHGVVRALGTFPLSVLGLSPDAEAPGNGPLTAC